LYSRLGFMSQATSDALRISAANVLSDVTRPIPFNVR
jgi:hypothetical protein